MEPADLRRIDNNPILSSPFGITNFLLFSEEGQLNWSKRQIEINFNSEESRKRTKTFN